VQVIGERGYIKLVFFGTALAGKTTVLEWLFHNVIPAEMKLVPELKQVKTSFGQTLMFDFVPVKVSENLVARIYTSTGQDYYKGTRPQILDGADGILLVIDSQRKEFEHNRELVDELRQYLEDSKDLSQAEIIVLFNKQDMHDVITSEELSTGLGLNGWLWFETSALTGHNLDKVLVTMLKRLVEKLEAEGWELL
jgi:signal recognition particle receptor subunit beta